MTGQAGVLAARATGRRIRAAACLVVASCSGPSENSLPGAGVPTGAALSISPVTANLPPGSTQEVLDALTAVAGAGARGYFLSYRWSELEPRAGVYQLGGLQSSLQTIAGLGFNRVLVGLQVINTTRRETPADLVGLAWDAPALQLRFRQLLDRVVPLFGPGVAYLSIGNEVDAYLGSTGEWTAYQGFFSQARLHARSLRPGLAVGATTIFDGARGPWRAEVAALNAGADVVIWTYYGNDGSFRTLPAEAGPRALSEMVGLAARKPVVVQEFGQASSAVNGGSEGLQARFLAQSLTAWNRLGGEAIPFLNVFALHDFPGWLCDELLQYYGTGPNTAFREYLCSLGLRRQDGSAKPSWDSVAAFGRRQP